MNSQNTFEALIDLARQLGLTVRHAHLGGNGGGLARLRDQQLLFVDLDADAMDQLRQTAMALAGQPGLETIYLRPDVRSILDENQS